MHVLLLDIENDRSAVRWHASQVKFLSCKRAAMLTPCTALFSRISSTVQQQSEEQRPPLHAHTLPHGEKQHCCSKPVSWAKPSRWYCISTITIVTISFKGFCGGMTSLLQEAGVPRLAREAQGGSGKAFLPLA